MGALQTPVKISLKNILIATDFSPCSEKALYYAAAIARRHGAKLFVAHRIAPEPPLAEPVVPVPEEIDPEHIEAKKQMKLLLANPQLAAIPTEALVKRGDFWRVLDEMIENRKIDLLVAGTHGREGLKQLMLGSVAEQIFRHARCPVLTVGPHVDLSVSGDGRLQHLLCATDFSEGSLHALPYVFALAEEDDARVTLMHVLTATISTELATLFGGEYPDNLVTRARQRLETLLSDAGERRHKTELIVACGTPADCILRKAAEKNSSLIVMGVHHVAASHAPWTTAHKVVCHAHCPVLTVRGR